MVNFAPLLSVTLNNPLVLALIVAVICNILGYLENYTKEKQAYEKSKLFETILRDLFVSFAAYLYIPGNEAGIVAIFEVVLRLIKEVKK